MSRGLRLTIGIGAAAVIAAISILVFTGVIDHEGDTNALTVLVIRGAVALVAVIALVAVVYNVLGLTDVKQAMGLPEGSVRSVIALLLLVIFAMLAVYFYEGLQSGGATTTLLNQTQAQLTDFIAKHSDAANLSISVAPQKPPAAGDGGLTNAVTNSVAGGTANPPTGKDATPPATLYNITYGGGSSAANDFAKTLMAALETLLTTVIGFYFGAKTATSSAAAGAASATNSATAVTNAVQAAASQTPTPTLSNVDPATLSIAAGSPAAVKILGANLNGVIHARLERAGAQVALTNVASNPTQVTGQAALDASMEGAPWDVVVDDGAGNTQRLKGAVTVGA